MPSCKCFFLGVEGALPELQDNRIPNARILKKKKLYKLPELGGRGGEVIWVMSVRNVFGRFSLIMPILLPVSHSLQNEVSTKSSEDCNGGISPPAMGCFTLLCSQILFFLILSTFFSPIFFYQIFGRLRWGDFSSTKSNGVLYTALLANTFLLPFFIPICQHFYSKCSFCNRPGNVELKGFS